MPELHLARLVNLPTGLYLNFFVHVAFGCGSVHLWQHFYTFGFVDDVLFHIMALRRILKWR